MMYNYDSVNFYACKLAEPLQNFTIFSVSLKTQEGLSQEKLSKFSGKSQPLLIVFLLATPLKKKGLDN